MLFRIILISYLLTSEGYGTSQVKSEMYSYKTESFIPEYCKELNQIYNHDYIEKWSAKEEDYLCIDGQEQGFKYEELMNEARAINVRVIKEDSAKFRQELRDELVQESLSKLQSFTIIPDIALNKKNVLKLNACLNESLDNTHDKKDIQNSLEGYVSNFVKDSIIINSYRDQLKKLKKNFETEVQPYIRYDAIARERERRNKHKSKRKGPNLKVNRYRDVELDQKYKQDKAEYDRNKKRILGLMYRVVDNNPILFNINKDWSIDNFLEDEVEFSDLGEDIIELVPDKVKKSLVHFNWGGIEKFANTFNEDLVKVTNSIINNKSLTDDIKEELEDHIEDELDEVVELCRDEGKRLHNFPLLVDQVMKKKASDPKMDDNEFLYMHASYCYLLEEEPIIQRGFLNNTSSGVTGGVGLVGTGLLFTPLAPIGGFMVAASTTVFTVDAIKIAGKQYDLLEENELLHSVGWNSMANYIENNQSFYTSLGSVGLNALIWGKFVGQPIYNQGKKVLDVRSQYKSNIKSLDNDNLEEISEKVHKAHQVVEAPTSAELKVVALNTSLRESNEAFVFPTLFRNKDFGVVLDDLTNMSGKSYKKIMKKLSKMSSRINEVKDDAIHLGEAIVAQKRLEMLTSVKFRDISPQNPLVLDLPILKSGKILKNSGGKKKITFNSDEELQAYIGSLRESARDNMLKHLSVSSDDAPAGLKSIIDDIDEYEDYMSSILKLKTNGKLAAVRNKEVRQAYEAAGSENATVQINLSYINKNGQIVKSSNGDGYTISINGKNDFNSFLNTNEQIIKQGFDTSRTQIIAKETEFGQRTLRQAELMEEFNIVKQKLGHIPPAERSFEQEALLLKLEKVIADKGLRPLQSEVSRFNSQVLSAERKEVRRRYINKLSLRQWGKRPGEDGSKAKRIGVGLGYFAAAGTAGTVALNEITFDIEDAIRSGNIGRVRAHFVEYLDVTRRTIFGASDDELKCASQMRGFNFEKICLLPLLHEYLIVEYTKRKNNPSYDITNDPVAKQKTIDYIKFMLELRNFRGDGAVSQLFDTHKFKAANHYAALVLSDTLALVDNFELDEVSLAHNIIITQDPSKKAQLYDKLKQKDENLFNALKTVESFGNEQSLIDYGELPQEAKVYLNKLIGNASKKDDELALIEAIELGKLLK